MLLWVLCSGFYPSEARAGDLLASDVTALASGNKKTRNPWFYLLTDKDSQIYSVFLGLASSRLAVGFQDTYKGLKISPCVVVFTFPNRFNK